MSGGACTAVVTPPPPRPRGYRYVGGRSSLLPRGALARRAPRRGPWRGHARDQHRWARGGGGAVGAAEGGGGCGVSLGRVGDSPRPASRPTDSRYRSSSPRAPPPSLVLLPFLDPPPAPTARVRPLQSWGGRGGWLVGRRVRDRCHGRGWACQGRGLRVSWAGGDRPYHHAPRQSAVRAAAGRGCSAGSTLLVCLWQRRLPAARLPPPPCDDHQRGPHHPPQRGLRLCRTPASVQPTPHRWRRPSTSPFCLRAPPAAAPANGDAPPACV